MNAVPSPNTLDHARAEMERMARAAMSPDSARGWWHAARIVRLFGHAARALKQHAQNARFFADSAPEKAAAYRDAMGILARYTGESLAVFEAQACEQTFDFVDTREESELAVKTRSAAKTKTKATKKRGSGSIGWVGFGTQGERAVVVGSSGEFPSSRPSYRSRSSLHCPDLFPSACIPFIGGWASSGGPSELPCSFVPLAGFNGWSPTTDEPGERGGASFTLHSLTHSLMHPSLSFPSA
jgi:hypothetical protein